MNLGEARHRPPIGDDELQDELLLLLDYKEMKLHKKKTSETFVEGLAFNTKLLVIAFFFAFAVFLILSSFFNKKIVLESPLTLRHKQHRRIQQTEIETNYHAKLFPRSDHRVLEWLQSSEEIKQLRAKNKGALNIGLLDPVKPDVVKWKDFAGGQQPTVFSSVTSEGAAKMKRFTWSDFFPEEIHRDEEIQNAKCPEMPLPLVDEKIRLDLLVANFRWCDADHSGSRDISALQSALAAAQIASKTSSELIMHVVVVSECRPLPNVFKCKELLHHQEEIWHYKMNLNRIRSLLALPVGSCKVAHAAPASTQPGNSREAYVTILHSVKSYVCGAVLLAHSIRKSGSTRDLVLLVDQHIRREDQQGLELAGWRVKLIDRIRNPKAKPLAYNEWNYSKFRLWQLTEYDKVIFVDADVVVVRNMDFLFGFPEISAARNHGSVFNSGVMVVEPCNCTFDILVRSVRAIESYNGGDQGFLNEIFTWWHRLPRAVNFLKHFDEDVVENEWKVGMFAAEPAAVYGMHFLGTKPWLCGSSREFDCNKQRDFANHVVHRKWWKLHDGMPKKLQKFCSVNAVKRKSDVS